MHVWLIKFEEDLPIDKDCYQYRMSMLADQLLVDGHSVVRWASDFDHKLGRERFGVRHSVKVKKNYVIELLRSPIRYSGSHSMWRLAAIYLQSCSLAINMMKADKRPDVILTAMPAPITCLVAAVLAKIWKVPHYIDARDMWPDILLDELKGIKKLAVFPVVLLMRIELKVALKWAQGLIGITLPFRDYLLEVAGRIAGPNDAAFPIGYLEQDIKYDEKSEAAFWLEKGVHFSSREKIIYFAGTLNKTVLTEASKVAQALRIVEKSGLSVKMVFCGKGNAENAVRMHFFGLRNVIFPGHVGATHLRFLKEKSSIALLSVQSRKDYLSSLSNKFFDYSSGGLPIVTNLAGVPKATLERHQAGFCYETSEELADIIALLVLDEELLGQYSRNSRRMFVDHFDAKQVYSGFVRHLERGML